MSMGFELQDAQDAVQYGKISTQEAVEWYVLSCVLMKWCAVVTSLVQMSQWPWQLLLQQPSFFSCYLLKAIITVWTVQTGFENDSPFSVHHTLVKLYFHVYVSVHECASCTLVCTHTHTDTHIHTDRHTYTHTVTTQSHTYTCLYTHTHTHTHTYMQIYTHIVKDRDRYTYLDAEWDAEWHSKPHSGSWRLILGPRFFQASGGKAWLCSSWTCTTNFEISKWSLTQTL